METETRVYSVYSFNALYEESWSGARQTLDAIEEKGKEEEFVALIDEMLSNYENGLTTTELNDFIWFDTDFIEESLNCKLWDE